MSAPSPPSRGPGPPETVAQECVEGYLYARSPTMVLLLRRPPARGSIWVPVSGKVDRGDAGFEAALRRELAEETGLHEAGPLLALDWHVTFRANNGELWRLHAFAVRVDRKFAPRLSAEHDAFEWVSPSEALARLHYSDNRDAVRRLLDKLGEPAPNA